MPAPPLIERVMSGIVGESSMEQETLFNEKPAESGRDPYWILASLFGLIILLTHGLEQARAFGWSFGDSGDYFHRIAHDGSDLAFASLFVLVIWFGRKRHWVVLFSAGLGALIWIEHELISFAFFGGFLRDFDWWEWKSIAPAMTVVLAIVSMPVVRWLSKSKRVFTNSISIADIMLLTMATAVLIVASSHVAALPMTIGIRGGPFPQFIPSVGWDSVIEHLIASGLMALIAAVVIYVSYFGRFGWGFVAYCASWVVFLAGVDLVGIVRLKPVLVTENLKFNRIWMGEYDHYVVVFTLFLLCIVIARLASRFFANPADQTLANETN